MTKKIRLFSVALAVFVVVLMAFAGTALASYNFTTHAADHSMVIDATSTNKHNVVPAGENPCESCHVPHGANGAFLWSVPVPQAVAGQQVAGVNVDVAAATSAPYGSDIKPLCYSCHDGTTLVPRTSGPADVVSIGSMTAFSTTHFNHRTRAASSVNPTTGAKTGIGADCDRCHDPHDDSYGRYLRPEYSTRLYDENGQVVKVNATGTAVVPYSADPANAYNATGATGPKTVRRYSPLIVGANFCATCHESNLPGVTATTKRNVHPVYQPAGVLLWNSATSGLANLTITGSGSSLTAYLNSPSTTPVLATNPVPGKNPLASVWPKAGLYRPTTADYNGTRVFDPAAPGFGTQLLTPTATGVVSCESCHAPHGANDGVATEGTSSFHWLNTMAADTLCANCH